MPESTPELPAPEGCAASPCSAVLAQIKGMGVRKVMASTQYGMGFLLVEQGPPDARGGIAYRNDSMSHAERIELAREVNRHLAPESPIAHGASEVAHAGESVRKPCALDRMVEWSDQLRQKFNLKSETKLDEYWSGYRDCVDDLDRFLMKMHEEEIQQNSVLTNSPANNDSDGL